MKPAILIFLFINALIGCTKKEVSPVQPRVVTQFVIDGKTYALSDGFSANEHCDFLFFSFNNFRKFPEFAVRGFPYTLAFKMSTNGELMTVDMDDDSNEYRASAFAPKRFTVVKQFIYNTTDNQLTLALETTLFNTKTLQPIVVKTMIDKMPIRQINCGSSFNNFGAAVESVGMKTTQFIQLAHTAETNNVSIQPPYPTPTYYRQTICSTDGYRITFENGKGLQSLKQGSYDVSSGSTTPFKVTFQEFLKETQPNRFGYYIENEWRSYQVIGKLEIVEEYTYSGKVVGRLSFAAYDEANKLAYTIKNGAFTVYHPLR